MFLKEYSPIACSRGIAPSTAAVACPESSNEIGPDAPNYVALQTVLESLLALSPWPEQLPEITESLQAFANATEMLR